MYNVDSSFTLPQYKILKQTDMKLIVRSPDGRKSNYLKPEGFAFLIDSEFKHCQDIKTLALKLHFRRSKEAQNQCSTRLGDGKTTEFLAVKACNQNNVLKNELKRLFNVNQKIEVCMLVTLDENGWDAILIDTNFTQVITPIELKNRHVIVTRNKTKKNSRNKKGQLTYSLSGSFKCHSTQKNSNNNARELIIEKHQNIPLIGTMSNILYHKNIIGDIVLIPDSGKLLAEIDRESNSQLPTIQIPIVSLYSENKYSEYRSFLHIEKIT